MPNYCIAHYREVRRFVWINNAKSPEEAIEKAQTLDREESDSELWEIEDNDPGEYEVREVQEDVTDQKN